MPIQQVNQFSDQNNKIWFTEVTIEVDATNKMQLNIGGTALVPINGVQTSYPLNAQIPFIADGAHHVLIICRDGTLVLDPNPTVDRNLAGQICWFDLPVGTADLTTITINQLVHVQEGS